jgi:hypothetical protein
VEGVTLEVVDSGDPRQLGLVEDAAGQDEEAGRQLVPAAGGDLPAPVTSVWKRAWR